MDCNTAACDAFARLLKASINRSADPCEFACYDWRRKTPYSIREYHYYVTLDYMCRFTDSVQIPPSGQNALQQVAAFYRSYTLQLPTSGHDDALLVKTWLVEAGVLWPLSAANLSV
ncbi:hypothetical protein MRX96_030722 [Rhipicephalus microplus]